MVCLVRTSLLAGAVVLPTLAWCREYRRVGLYGSLAALSYWNHSQHCPPVAYADRLVALTCVVDLWQRSTAREQRSLLLGISLYLLRHATKDVTYHAAAHAVFATTAVLNSLQGSSTSPPPHQSLVLLSLLVLAWLPSHHHRSTIQTVPKSKPHAL